MIGLRAPGRVNLIGDHTDYNDGFCLPLAIDRECLVTGTPGADGRVRVRSRELDGPVDLAADGSDDPSGVEPAWGRFVAGVLRALRELGRPPTGFDGTIASTVPPGSGLSSSSALSVALTLALGDAGALDLPDRRVVARAALRAEVLATGVPGGLMDQMASLFGVAEHALLLDCRSLDVTPVALPRSHAVLVVHSGVARTLVGSRVRGTARGLRSRGPPSRCGCARATRRWTRSRTTRSPVTSSPRTSACWTSPGH